MVYRIYRDNTETRPRRVSILVALLFHEISTSYNLSSCIQPPTLRLKLSLPLKLKTVISYAFKIWTYYSTGVIHFATSLTTEKKIGIRHSFATHGNPSCRTHPIPFSQRLSQDGIEFAIEQCYTRVTGLSIHPSTQPEIYVHDATNWAINWKNMQNKYHFS